MTQILAAQLADWIDNNTKGFARRHGNIIYIEGKIDAYELAKHALSLIGDRSTEQIYADNKAKYTSRSVAEGG